ncbi:hypothetical protein [Carboxylicivirga caseinilyticus]|uniref:hypothetical protein n=1 Tax=Carboxylicivirga caseinilyticus TaxID=3417572 RepID=UPI003D32E373|nr:hypothetical protein [Marinilabiliaceae bacterium A049]
MKKFLLVGLLAIGLWQTKAQQVTDTNGFNQNSAQRLLDSNKGLTIGGYGEVHYNQPISSDVQHNGKLDVHRVVILIGYNFNERTQFVSEVEYEHVSEVYIEQAFLQYKLNNSINFRGGLMLIPMGIINEYHEPTTFNGVERPLVDNYIAPTTWREVGVGITGNILPVSVRYQAYIVNGFNGYDGSLKFNGSNGLRKGRQKGAESYISSPNLSAKVEYFGTRGLNIGLSGYFGRSQSKAFDGLDKNDNTAGLSADSTYIGLAMLGLDARYNLGGIELRGQYYYSELSNTDKYNAFGSTNSSDYNDLGSAMMGYYVEAGYNILKNNENTSSQLIPFVRYEQFDTHRKVHESITRNDAYNKTAITTGFSWRITQGAVVKADMQFIKSKADSEFSKVFNAGVGVMF